MNQILIMLSAYQLSTNNPQGAEVRCMVEVGPGEPYQRHLTLHASSGWVKLDLGWNNPCSFIFLQHASLHRSVNPTVEEAVQDKSRRLLICLNELPSSEDQGQLELAAGEAITLRPTTVAQTWIRVTQGHLDLYTISFPR